MINKKFLIFLMAALLMCSCVMAINSNPFRSRYNQYGHHNQWVNAIFDLTNDTIFLSTNYNITQSIFNFTDESMILSHLDVTTMNVSGETNFVNISVTDSAFVNNLRGISGADINVENNIDGTGFNATFDYYNGDGSLLSGILSNPVTENIDYNNYNLSGANNISAVLFDGNVSWNKITQSTFPSACPSGAVTTIGNTIICSPFLTNGTVTDKNLCYWDDGNSLVNCTITDGSTNWNTAYSERISQVAGTHLTWNTTDVNVDDDFLLNTGDSGTGNYDLDNLTINTKFNVAGIFNITTNATDVIFDVTGNRNISIFIDNVRIGKISGNSTTLMLYSPGGTGVFILED